MKFERKARINIVTLVKKNYQYVRDNRIGNYINNNVKRKIASNLMVNSANRRTDFEPQLRRLLFAKR